MVEARPRSGFAETLRRVSLLSSDKSHAVKLEPREGQPAHRLAEPGPRRGPRGRAGRVRRASRSRSASTPSTSSTSSASSRRRDVRLELADDLSPGVLRRRRRGGRRLHGRGHADADLRRPPSQSGRADPDSTVRLALPRSSSDFRNLARGARSSPRRGRPCWSARTARGRPTSSRPSTFLCTLKPLRATRLAELVRFGAERARGGRATFEGPGRRADAGGRDRPTARGPPSSTARPMRPARRLLRGAGGGLLLPRRPPAREGRAGRAAPLPRPRRLQPLAGGARRGPRLRARAAGAERGAAPGRARGRGELPGAARRAPGPGSCARRRGAPRRARARAWRTAFARDLRAGGARRRGSPTGRPRACAIDGTEAELAGAARPTRSRRGSRRDRERGYTSAGPHMDDLALALGGKGARSYGSQGQQRALVLALKIAEIENLRAALRPPAAPPARRRLVRARPGEERPPAAPPGSAPGAGLPHHHGPRACSSRRPARRARFFRVREWRLRALIS